MYLEIVSPEATLFSHEVDSVVVPGINGEFEMLNNHAPIVSLLQAGVVRIKTHSQNIALEEVNSNLEKFPGDNKVLTLQINSGTIEMKDNKIIVLAD